MSSSRSAGKSSKKSRTFAPRTRGSHSPIGEVTGSGTADDPQITWLIGRPKGEAGDIYKQIVRDAANVSGLGAWYIRSIVHFTTTLGGAAVRDDAHFTVFADTAAGGSLQADYEYEGHIYIALEEGTRAQPRRPLHPDEFEFPDGTAAPVILWDTVTRDEYTYYFSDDYYDNCDGYYGEEEAAADIQGGSSREAGKTKKKRKRKGKGKGKGKAADS